MNKFAHLTQNKAAKLSRRGFMIGATAAGFTMAFAPSELAFGVGFRDIFEPTVWYDIDTKGIVTVNVAEAEMGQHVGTAFARIIADELEADWRDVRVRYVDTNPKYGYRVTGGSWSVWQNFDLLSRAGAAGRKVLIEEGAKILGVPSHKCKAKNSSVSYGKESVRYSEIVGKGNLNRQFSDEELVKMPIKAKEDRTLIGFESEALDIPAKTQGTAVYGIDASVPGMVYGKPLLPPTRYGCTLLSIDDAAAKKIPGYQQTLILDDPSNTIPGWGIVIADTYAAALIAERLIKAQWQESEASEISESDILQHGIELINSNKGSLVVEDKGVDEAFENAHTLLSQTYTTSTVLHFQMEPVNALAFEKDGLWELHTGNQWQSLCLPTFAKALDVPVEKILMPNYLLGGGFGRRLNGDYGVPALLASKKLGKPVKVVFSREDDSRFDSPRSASVQSLSMAFDREDKILGMQHHASAGWPTEVMADFFLGEGKNGEKFDPFSISGANHWYAVGSHRVRAISNDLANRTFRPGWLRSVGPGWTNWALESFMDEAAQKVGVDPVKFRLQHLMSYGINAGSKPNSVGGANRLAHVLNEVAKKAQWGSEMPEGTGQGVATTFGQERDMPTWCACVATVHVDRASGKVSVKRLDLVIDAGSIVHPDGALAQSEGAALWGLSMALFEGTVFENGQVKDTNLDTYKPLRMSDVPELNIEFVESRFQSVGLGEPATTVVGPAIANAIFAASGARLRHLPITSAAVKEALKG
ncbi:MAG: isoquinoline 1-oxidoreductase beta subunit [Candidatus Azotimanducaceae bacterium]|jgi:isoquinoline 1-oxidoreductase beta subunit